MMSKALRVRPSIMTLTFWVLFSLVSGCEPQPADEASVTSSEAGSGSGSGKAASQSFDSQASFPPCDATFEGSIVFSKADKKFFVCEAGEYLSSSESERDTESNVSGSKLTANCTGALDEIPDPSGVNGQLVLELPSEAADIDPCSLEGYVVGNQQNLKLQMTKSGEYFVNDVPPGEQDLIVTAGALQIESTSGASLKLVSGSPSNGIRMNDLRSTSGLRNSVGEVVLPKLSEISGTARLNSSSVTDHAGITVYIPGTGYSAFTAPDGSYTIANVPAGAHSLFFEKDGFSRGQIEGFVIGGGEEAEAPTVNLYLDAGISGSFSVVNSVVLNSKTVVLDDTANLLMAPSNGAVLMLIGDGRQAASWQSVRTNFSWDYVPDYFLQPNQWGYTPPQVDSPAEASIKAKFANANGLESDVISKTVYVDFFSNGTTRFTPQFTTALLSSPKRIEVTGIQTPVQAEQSAVIHQKPSVWNPTITFGAPASSKTILLTDKIENCGDHKINVQFRGYGGKVYSPLSDSILSGYNSFAQAVTNSCHTAVPSTSAMTITGIGESGFDEKWYGIWTGSEVVVWGWNSSNTFSGAYYSPATSTWSSAMSSTNAPAKRVGAQTIAVGGKVVFWSGSDGSNETHHFNVYDPATNSWSSDSGANAPTFSGIETWRRRMFAVNGKLHFVYGKALTSTQLQACDTEDPDSLVQTGSECDPLNDGNESNNPDVSSSYEQAMQYVSYDPASHSWSNPVVLPRYSVMNRSNFHLIGYASGTDSILLMVAGGTDSGSTATVEKLQVSSTGVVTVLARAANYPQVTQFGSIANDAVFSEAGTISMMSLWSGSDGFKVYNYNTSADTWSEQTIPQSVSLASGGSLNVQFQNWRPQSIFKSGNTMATMDYSAGSLTLIKLSNSSAPAAVVGGRFSSADRFGGGYGGTTPAVRVAIPGQGIFIWAGKYSVYGSSGTTNFTPTDGAIVKTSFADEFAN